MMMCYHIIAEYTLQLEETPSNLLGVRRENVLVFQTFLGRNYLFSKLFKVIFTWAYVNEIHQKELSWQNFIVEMSQYHLYRYRNSDHTMSAIYNKSKVTNAWWGINQCNEKVYFPRKTHSFQRFFQTLPYLWSFSRLFKAWKISTLNSMTFPGSVRTLPTTACKSFFEVLLTMVTSGMSTRWNLQCLSPYHEGKVTYLYICTYSVSFSALTLLLGHHEGIWPVKSYANNIQRFSPETDEWRQPEWSGVKWVGFNVPLNTL